MKTEEINKLLADYYEGNTSESQEELLKNYFRTHEVPEKYKADQKLFLCLYPDLVPEVPHGLEEKLSRMIDSRGSDNNKPMLKRRRPYIGRWFTGIAAGVTVVIGMALTFMTFDLDSSHPKDTFQDPYQAYLVMQETLIEVSFTMNDGLEQLASE